MVTKEKPITAFKNFFEANPIFFPAVILAAVIYSPAFKIAEPEFSSAFPRGEIAMLSGTVSPRPVRFFDNAKSAGKKIGGRTGETQDTGNITRYGGRYTVALILDAVGTVDGAVSSASGTATVSIPSSLYEIYSPGKLNSLWRGEKIPFLVEEGAHIVFEVQANGRGEFLATGIKSADWKGKAPLKFFRKVRALSRLHFKRIMYAWGEAGGLILALLSGSREYLSSKIKDAFKNAGLSHVLALSGMHLSLFSGMAFFLGKRSAGKKYAVIFECAAMLLFFWFAEKSPSLFRALLCSLFGLGAHIAHLKVKSPLNILSLSFLIHTTLFPRDAFEISFMLSYGAYAGIVCFSEIFLRPLCRHLPLSIASPFATSSAAQTISAPITLKFFGVITPFGILSSVIVSPLITIFIYTALFFLVVALVFPIFAPLFGTILGVFYKLLESIVLLLSALPRISIR